MDRGQIYAAEAAELRRAELGLTQGQTGVDRRTWREFVNAEKWPATPLTRARIEAHLNWHLGSLTKIARGEVTPEQAALEHEQSEERQPAPILTQQQAEALLERRLVERYAISRLVKLLREAVEEKREMDALRLTTEIEDILEGKGPDPV